jgi:hypothetical protein
VSENRVPRTIFGPKRDEMMVGRRKLVRFAKYNWNDQVKEDEMGRACSMNRKKRNAYRILVGKQKGIRPLGRLRRRWVDNIKMDLR